MIGEGQPLSLGGGIKDRETAVTGVSSEGCASSSLNKCVQNQKLGKSFFCFFNFFIFFYLDTDCNKFLLISEVKQTHLGN